MYHFARKSEVCLFVSEFETLSVSFGLTCQFASFAGRFQVLLRESLRHANCHQPSLRCARLLTLPESLKCAITDFAGKSV